MKFRRRLFTSCIKCKIRQIHVVVVQNGKEMYKKLRRMSKVFVLPSKLIFLDIPFTIAS